MQRARSGAALYTGLTMDTSGCSKGASFAVSVWMCGKENVIYIMGLSSAAAPVHSLW